ncbi:MAG: DUF3795 domain-containing protein [Deltaproteobacteria bacterium]|nr:DUF3795 domain-containing protein [Deltaproteobacteria bacterium]MBW2082131.1 DUF3795 domain-containing protein [Deltaproteobacteria bacterium]RLB82181.1 MAG: DUF3795 domain-containing protein [Deltaproteobacteria bacterium]HDM10047.1 DUF3795 domain-containing protein [Desulfobacteraceae bacterium]
MVINKELMGPCGLYCGVCAILIADRDNNDKFKERLVNLYRGGIPGKGTLPGSESLTIEDIKCSGCMSDNIFKYCKICEIKRCTKQRGYVTCHQCDEWPCEYIENFPMTVGKKVILRAIPQIRQWGLERFMEEEESRYVCPECGNKVFRGAARCNKCKTELDLD